MSSFVSDLESYASGAAVSGWTNKGGTWVVSTNRPVSGTKSFGPSDGQGAVLYTGNGAHTDGVYAIDQIVAHLNLNISLIVRANAANESNYLFLLGWNSTTASMGVTFYKNVSGTYTELSATGNLLTGLVVGNTLHSEVKVSGSNFELRVWKNAEAKPTNPSASFSDSTYATGYPGLYYNGLAVHQLTADNISFVESAPPVVALTSSSNTLQLGAGTCTFTATLNQPVAADTLVTFSDSSGGGSFSLTQVNIPAGQTVGTSIYTPGSVGTKSISITATNNFTPSGSPQTLTVTAANATLATLSGPTGAPMNTNVTLTVTLNGPAATNTSFSFADTGNSSFSPNPVVIAQGSSIGYTTFNPTSFGNHSITMTNNQTLSQSGSPLLFDAAAAGTFVPTSDANWFWAPYVWDTVGSAKRANSPGSYCYLGFTGTSVSVIFDISAFTAASVATNKYPQVRFAIDDRTSTIVQLSPSVASIAVTGLAAGSHVLKLWFESAYTTPNEPDRWNTPVNAVVISGATVDNAATTVAPTLRPKRALCLGDSITEGQYALGVATEVTGSSALATWVPPLAMALNAEYGQLGYGGVGYYSGGTGGVPPLYGSLSHRYFCANRTRLVSNLFNPAPDYIFIAHGTNGPTTTTAMVKIVLEDLRLLAPNSEIYVIVPFGRFNATTVIGGFNEYMVAHPADTKMLLVDLGSEYAIGMDMPYAYGGTDNATDGLHAKALMHAKIAAGIAAHVAAPASGGSQTPSVPMFSNRFNRSLR